jgi:hypothetical protein
MRRIHCAVRRGTIVKVQCRTCCQRGEALRDARLGRLDPGVLRARGGPRRDGLGERRERAVVVLPTLRAGHSGGSEREDEE